MRLYKGRLSQMSKPDNITVFQNTEYLCNNNQKLIGSIENSRSLQSLILENEELPPIDKNIYDTKAQVVVSKKRTYEAASGYKGTKTAVLNFASATNPGGGVVCGANAQEECLCRCSTLFFNLNTEEMMEDFYRPHRMACDPLHNDDIIFTPEVTVFKTDTTNPILMDETDWYDVDVVTCAAPNLRSHPSNLYNIGDGEQSVRIHNDDLLLLHEKRLQRILDVALMNRDETVILGAFGCGAFKNDPEIVALAAKNVIKDYLYAFKNIEFAVYCSPRDETNYETFERMLNDYSH